MPRRSVPRSIRSSSTAALALSLAVTMVAAGCRGGGVVENEKRRIADGERLVDSLRKESAVSDASAIALGYVERLRMGAAAPFRLVEQASVDPRLPVAFRDRVAWALVDRIHRGDAFQIDSTALGDGPDAPPTVLVDGGWHRAFIDSLVAAAPAARTGEETVRLTYALARAEWLITPQTAVAAVDAAALARDRRLARADADRLLAAPLTETDSTRLLLARSWRIARLFASERPLLADDLAPDHARAVQDAERALAVLRVAALGTATPAEPARPATGTVSTRVGDTTVDTTGLGVAVAARLSTLPSVRTGFPAPPIVVSLGGFHRTTGTPTGTQTTAQLVRSRLLARARTDESLVAEWTLARATLPAGDPERPQLARAVQSAVVATRAQAQDAPAFATPTTLHDGLVSVASLRWRDRMRGVTADADLPPLWGPHIATTVNTATANLRSVLPTLDLDGLALRVGENPRHDLALALHDPARRTVYLPPLTGAGTVAHEFAHDLDWQTARTQLGVRGVYATDRALRVPPATARGLRDSARTLAAAVRAMTGVHTTLPPTALGSALGAPPPGPRTEGDDRPAELFARGVDFFVAAALAREGRSDGTLSAVQDPLLVGYAGVRAPDPGDGTAEALVDVLAGMTRVPSASRQWYLAHFGREGTRTPIAIVGDVMRASPMWSAEASLRAFGVPVGLTGSDRSVLMPANAAREGCHTGPGGGAAAPWQGHLLWLAADARGRGYVRARAIRASTLGSSWWGWTAQSLIGGPWRTDLADRSVDRMRDAILRAAAIDRERRLPFANAGGGCPW